VNISQLSLLQELSKLSPQESKAFIKLISVDVLKNLGSGKYLVNIEGKEVRVQSEASLNEGSKVWGVLEKSKNNLLLNKVFVMPKAMQNLLVLKDDFGFDFIQKVLESKNPAQSFKNELLEHMAKAPSKEHFSAYTQMFLALEYNIMTFPFEYQKHFGVYQMKKRYNKKSKKSYLDFYAMFERLGVIEGSIALIEGAISVSISAVFQESIEILETELKNFPFASQTTLTLKNSIEPLYAQEKLTLLDVRL